MATCYSSALPQIDRQLHSVAMALTGGAPLLDRPIKPRVLGADEGYETWPLSISGYWLQAGTDFYRFPLLEHRVDEPAALSRVPYDECAVLGSPEMDRFWLITIFSSGVTQTCTLAAYDMRTGAQLYTIVTDTTHIAADVFWSLWPEQAMAARHRDGNLTLHSLTSGALVKYTPPLRRLSLRSHRGCGKWRAGALANVSCCSPEGRRLYCADLTDLKRAPL